MIDIRRRACRCIGFCRIANIHTKDLIPHHLCAARLEIFIQFIELCQFFTLPRVMFIQCHDHFYQQVQRANLRRLDRSGLMHRRLSRPSYIRWASRHRCRPFVPDDRLMRRFGRWLYQISQPPGGLAIISVTDQPPALSPKIVTFSGSPP